MHFYPENSKVTIDAVRGKGELRYILVVPFTSLIASQDITLKYAFGATWKTNSPVLKDRIREILVTILDIAHFQIQIVSSRVYIIVPVKPLDNLLLLPKQGVIEVPLVVKLAKKSLTAEENFEIKCQQTICLDTDAAETAKESQEEYLDLPEEKIATRLASQAKTAKSAAEMVTPAIIALPAIDTVVTTQSGDLEVFKRRRILTEPMPEMSSNIALEAKSPEAVRHLYRGIMAIDFGTTNSVVVVHDPRYGAEEIRNELSQEQWATINKWLEIWLSDHLSQPHPSPADKALDGLTRQVKDLKLPLAGSLIMEIEEGLHLAPLTAKQELLAKTISYISSFHEEVATEEKPSLEIVQQLAAELLDNFEKAIYTKSLESQRYFVLELDQNAGPGPVSSALQIVAAPCSADKEKLEAESEVEMGVRVKLLMRSAVMREADIRQFALTIKRYFGQHENIELVPSETASVPISFPVDTLCRLAYKKLIERALDDIKRRFQLGSLDYADWVRCVVATFPTTYPASLRRKLRDMLNELEIDEIDTRFDEATASAIYYIWRDVCADPICGMDGIIARCRHDRHRRAYQNVLLYDLGGGTTDVALIQLIYEEIPIFEPIDKKRYENGRYFRITPRLLGSTGHRYIGGDLITLWLFRLVKTKLADRLLSLMVARHVEPPPKSPLANLLNELPDELCRDGQYIPGSLLDWTYTPAQNFRTYEKWNHEVINHIVPTMFDKDTSCTPNFFTLWELTEEAKKELGSPLTTYIGSGIGRAWKEKIRLDHGQMWKLLVNIHPFLETSSLRGDDVSITISQQELYEFAKVPVVESLNIAVNLVKARLRTQEVTDILDRFILSGFSCNLKVVQQEAEHIFHKYEGLFDFSLANVFFDQEVAKTSLAMGACIGRYLEAVRLDPYDERTRQMLREGYDQVELVVENLFNYLACKLVYGSLVAVVPFFDHGEPLNKRSYKDGKPVARTPMNELRPVQEKFWIYRIDYEGASPQYLGLIDAEAVAYAHELDFRQFREGYMVGFEADAELFVRAFFLPKGPRNILATQFLEDKTRFYSLPRLVDIPLAGNPVLRYDITSQELFNRKPALKADTVMENTIQYPDGSRYRCAVSAPLPVREIYDFYVESGDTAAPYPILAHFYLANEEPEELALACDETGRIVLLFSIIYDIKIWADIDYVPQKIDPQYDPFCGQH
jgi:hypothetical protein